MEVMLEIYKTLNVLGMQWRKKEGISMPDIGPPVIAGEGYTEEVISAIEQWSGETGVEVQMGKKPPAKKDASAAEKAAQGLYLVETRARYGDIMVSISLLNLIELKADNIRLGWISNYIELTLRTTWSTLEI